MTYDHQHPGQRDEHEVYSADCGPPVGDGNSLSADLGEDLGQDLGEDLEQDVADPSDSRVAAALAQLDGLAEVPPERHVEVYEQVHRVLQDALADAARSGDGQGPAAGSRP